MFVKELELPVLQFQKYNHYKPSYKNEIACSDILYHRLIKYNQLMVSCFITRYPIRGTVYCLL